MAFTGQLNSNEIFTSLYNMIISIQAFGDNIAGTNSALVDMFRVDGSLYGDQKLYVSTDILESVEWGADAEATNLLQLHRPTDPEVQAIQLDQFRQIRLTVDEYLSKQAWTDEGSFSQFNSVLMGWIRDTKRVYDAKLMNTFIGTTKATGAAQNITITIPATDASGEEANRLFAQTIATELADLVVNLTDPNRDYNDYGNMRSYDPKDLIIVWNSDFYNTITKMDLPTIFHKDGLLEKFGGEYILPAYYFGTVNAEMGEPEVARSLIEQTIGTKHVMPGELIPSGQSAPKGTSYNVDNKIAFKVIHKNSVPLMSAFEVGTSFYNPKSLTETHYLTWGYNTLEYLKNYPFITATTTEAP